MFFDISEELVVNILMRLSVKSLKKLSCVNKWCYNLIQSPYFISRHYSYHSACTVKLLVKYNLIKKGYISILSENDADCSHLSIPFFDKDSFSTIIGPCINGIICLRSFTGQSHESYKDIALFNVATGECNILPNFQLSFPPNAYLLPYIETIGFGWVPETNEYKVVMAIEFCNPNDHIYSYRALEVFVYTLSTNSWKQLNFEIPFVASTLESDPPFYSLIYLNGVCYWVNENNDGIYNLLSFHMRDEVFGSLPLPDLFTHDGDCLHFTLHTLDGCIALINNHSDEVNSHCLVEIWVLEESWIKKFTIGPLTSICMGLGLVKDELFLVDESGQLSSINIYSRDLKNLGIQGEIYSFQVLEYVDSFVPLKRRL